MEEMAPMVAMVTFFGAIGWIVSVTQRNRRVRDLIDKQYSLHQQMLQRFDDPQQLMQYLESDAASRFFDPSSLDKGSPYSRILGSIQVGLVLALAGAAFLVMRGQIHEALEPFTFIGVLSLALGVGFLLSAGVSYALSKSWGLVNGGRAQNDQ